VSCNSSNLWHGNHAEYQRHTEIAVCNLGSVNLVAPYDEAGRRPRLAPRPRQAEAHHQRRHAHASTNVIDINYYAVAKARGIRNLKHRPVGMGIMGFQDCLHLLAHAVLPSKEAVEFADTSMEAVCYLRLLRIDGTGRKKRGRYSSYRGSAVGSRHSPPQDFA